jgi:hypothetical protein
MKNSEKSGFFVTKSIAVVKMLALFYSTENQMSHIVNIKAYWLKSVKVRR